MIRVTLPGHLNSSLESIHHFTATDVEPPSILTNIFKHLNMGQEEQNKAFILKYYSALYGAKKTESLIRKYVSDQKLIDHILYFEKLFPCYKVVIDEMFAENNKVFVKVRFFGLHSGEVDGIPPTYKEIEIPFAISYTIENDNIIDFWTAADQVELMNQLIPAKDEPNL